MSDLDGLELKELTTLVRTATSRLENRVPGEDLERVAAPSLYSALEAATFAMAPPSALAPLPLDVLKGALRKALQLEFATIPPYLTALWSIIDQGHPVARSVRAVCHEEMLHLALLCNLLSALGERPVLTGAVVPTFPSRLPGGVHPDLTIHLEGYGAPALATFMKIERPEVPIPIADEREEVFSDADTTIGEFYVGVLDLFKTLNPELNAERQLAGPFTWLVLSKPDDVDKALTLIMAQGEGARGIPYNRKRKYLSHYYRFKSLFMQTELIWDDEAKILRKGDHLQPPAVFTLAPAAPGGYGLAAPQQLREASERFDACYSQMLRLLEASWQDGGHKCFVRALENMFELGTLAQKMMRIGTPDGRGYCPSFCYLP